MAVGSGRTQKEPDLTGEFMKPMEEVTVKHDYDRVAERFRYLGDCDRQANNCILEKREYMWKHKQTRGIVIEYLNNSLETSYFYVGLKDSLGKARINQRKIDVVLYAITPETALSDAQCMKIEKKFKDYKSAENPFKDFEQNFGTVFRRYQQLQEKLKDKMEELQKEELQLMEEFQLMEGSQNLGELKIEELQMEKSHQQLQKYKPKKKYECLWKMISLASAAAVAALSVAAAVFMPHAALTMAVPAFCAMGFNLASKVLIHSPKDKTVALKAEMRAEAQKKRAKANEIVRKAQNIVHTAQKCTVVTVLELNEAEISMRELTVASSSIDGYIDICLDDMEYLPRCVDDIKSEQKLFFEKLDGLRDDVDKYCDGLRERRKSLTCTLASYI